MLSHLAVPEAGAGRKDPDKSQGSSPPNSPPATAAQAPLAFLLWLLVSENQSSCWKGNKQGDCLRKETPHCGPKDSTVFPQPPISFSQQQSHFLPVSPLMHNFLSGQQRSLGKCVFLHSLCWCQATAENISKIQQASSASDSIGYPEDSKPPGKDSGKGLTTCH